MQKGSKFPAKENYEKNNNFPSSLLYNQTERERVRERKESSLNPVAPPSIGQWTSFVTWTRFVKVDEFCNMDKLCKSGRGFVKVDKFCKSGQVL
jgi:hypothetical protein